MPRLYTPVHAVLIIAFLHLGYPDSAKAQEKLESARLAEKSQSDSSTAAGLPTNAAPSPYSFRSKGIMLVEPDPAYEAGTLKRRIFGSGYRQLWTTPLDVPIIGLEETAGGLTPIERGGGLQTTSLHLEGGDGRFYVLRSVNKTAGLSLPEGFRGTFINSIVQDQISALNPVGALILPPLSRAAGIFHTEPTLVVIPS